MCTIRNSLTQSSVPTPELVYEKRFHNFVAGTTFLEVFQEVRGMNTSPRLGQSRFARNKDKYEEMPIQDISHLVWDVQHRP